MRSWTVVAKPDGSLNDDPALANLDNIVLIDREKRASWRWRGQRRTLERSVADACKGARIPRERREAPNHHFLPGVGEGSSDLATPFHLSGDGSPAAPDGGGPRGGSPVHRGARHQQGRVAAYRRPGSSTAPDVSAGSRAIRTARMQGRFTPPSCTPSLLAWAVGATIPPPDRGGRLFRPPTFI
jgi:hypothetical protein